MVNTHTGVDFSIFIDAISKYGDTSIIRSPVTLSLSNIESDEAPSYGTPQTINAYITRKTKAMKFDTPGFIEVGDILMLIKPSQAMVRGDKISWNGNDYRVDNVLNRDQIGGNVAYKVCPLIFMGPST